MTFAFQVQQTVMGYLLFKLYGIELVLGYLGLVEALPKILLSLPAGYLVENSEKRKILRLITLVYMLLSSLMLLVYQISGNQNMGIMIFSMGFVIGVLSSFMPAASISTLSYIIKDHDIPRYSALSSNAWQLGSISGPIISGFIIDYLGFQFSFVLAMLCYGISFGLLSFIPKIIPQKISSLNIENSIRDIKAGLVFVKSNSVLLWAITLDLVAVLFGGCVALLPAFANKIYGIEGSGYGLLRAAEPLGAMMMMFYLSKYPIREQIGKKLLLAVGSFGFFNILFGLNHYYNVALVLLFLIGLSDAVSVVIRSTLLLVLTPEDMKSRVSSINQMFITSSNEIGAFESGMAAHFFGLQRSVVYGGMITMSLVILGWFKAKKLIDFQQYKQVL
ncbi:MAG: MFS transporter [Chitinophagales bacterium]|nr:MFS transporter [Chitinophagales bacterium]